MEVCTLMPEPLNMTPTKVWAIVLIGSSEQILLKGVCPLYRDPKTHLSRSQKEVGKEVKGARYDHSHLVLILSL